MSDTTTAPAAADAATQAALERLNTVIDRLIAPDGCPWDSTQTPESLTEYVIEECHELVDAIRSGKTADMVEELGDVAFLILMIGKLMARAGGPSLADALEVEAAKMVRRHPHVFSDTTYENQSEQLKDWDRIKREEKAAADAEGPKGTYDSLPRGLPPLTKAYRIHSKADRVGFTWPENEDVEKQVEAEWLELLDAMASDDADQRSSNERGIQRGRPFFHSGFEAGEDRTRSPENRNRLTLRAVKPRKPGGWDTADCTQESRLLRIYSSR